jgi:hypothetical protein
MEGHLIYQLPAINSKDALVYKTPKVALNQQVGKIILCKDISRKKCSTLDSLKVQKSVPKFTRHCCCIVAWRYHWLVSNFASACFRRWRFMQKEFLTHFLEFENLIFPAFWLLTLPFNACFYMWTLNYNEPNIIIIASLENTKCALKRKGEQSIKWKWRSTTQKSAAATPIRQRCDMHTKGFVQLHLIICGVQRQECIISRELSCECCLCWERIIFSASWSAQLIWKVQSRKVDWRFSIASRMQSRLIIKARYDL